MSDGNEMKNVISGAKEVAQALGQLDTLLAGQALADDENSDNLSKLTTMIKGKKEADMSDPLKASAPQKANGSSVTPKEEPKEPPAKKQTPQVKASSENGQKKSDSPVSPPSSGPYTNGKKPDEGKKLIETPALLPKAALQEEAKKAVAEAVAPYIKDLKAEVVREIALDTLKVYQRVEESSAKTSACQNSLTEAKSDLEKVKKMPEEVRALSAKTEELSAALEAEKKERASIDAEFGRQMREIGTLRTDQTALANDLGKLANLGIEASLASLYQAAKDQQGKNQHIFAKLDDLEVRLSRLSKMAEHLAEEAKTAKAEAAEARLAKAEMEAELEKQRQVAKDFHRQFKEATGRNPKRPDVLKPPASPSN